MPIGKIHAPKNQYRGINAHLNSRLQAEGGWDSFHAIHLGDLTKTLRTVLFPLGYTADIEQSLQIKRAGAPTRQPESDVTIYDPDPVRAQQSAAPVGAHPHELVLTIPTMLALDDPTIEYYRSIVLVERDVESGERGKAVAWIELLSPSNKPRGRDFETYRSKRELLLQTGLVFVEIDYLHQTPPTFAGVPNYATDNPPEDAQPYRITVVDPRPEFLEGKGRSRVFGVDETIPTMTIPLSGDDRLDFDFDAPYQMTFEGMLYGNEVDYAQLPLKFENYSRADQTRIVNRMLAVIEASQTGAQLDAILPAPTHPLNVALSRLDALH